jgi:hypothetical protein
LREKKGHINETFVGNLRNEEFAGKEFAKLRNLGYTALKTTNILSQCIITPTWIV